MFNTKTVFVIGAGSSCELGLPTGDELRGALIEILRQNGDNYIFSNPSFNRLIQNKITSYPTNERSFQFNRYAQAVAKIRSALPMAQSIDNLLHAHRADDLVVKIGKIAIALAILEKEHSSHIKFRSRQVFDGIEPADLNNTKFVKSWYLPLMRLLVSGVSKENIDAIFENVSFIIFNYDRCLEHFLINALSSYFDLTPDHAAKIANTVEIIHPYGQVGLLPWQSRAHNLPVCQFGQCDSDIERISESIYTFTESSEAGIKDSCKNMIRNAETLVIMGYGFLPTNTELLSCATQSNVKRAFSTAFGIGENDVNILKSEIRRIICGLPGNFDTFVQQGGCRELMDKNWMRLTIK